MRTLFFIGCMSGHGVLYSLRMGWPARVSLMGVVHICYPCTEEKPKAVEGKEGAS